MGLLSLLGCQFSTKELPRSLSELGVAVEVEQRTERSGYGRSDFEYTRVTATLKNKKGVAIESDQVTIRFDGEPLTSKVQTGNYGEHHPWHELDVARHPIEADREYLVEVVWTDGTVHRLGRLRTPKRLGVEQFDLPDSIGPGASLALTWRDLAEPIDLWAYRTWTYTDSLGNHVIEAGSANDPEAIKKSIGPGIFRAANGSLPLPAAFLAPREGRRVVAVGFDLVARRSAGTSREFAKSSTLEAVRQVVLRTDVGDDGDRSTEETR
ncbi:MAG: hypothetical protein U0527_14335 [Candidatus Eisenbacteria bacterium]